MAQRTTHWRSHAGKGEPIRLKPGDLPVRSRFKSSREDCGAERIAPYVLSYWLRPKPPSPLATRVRMGFVFKGVARSTMAKAASVVLLAVFFAACKSDTSNTKVAAESSGTSQAVEVIDDAGLIVHLAQPAQRIISLIPSATETLIAIGATARIVGRTRYDVAPEVMHLPSVGGGVDPSVEAIVALNPDLVVGWESDKRQQIRSKLLALNIPMFILRTQDTSDVFRGMKNLGHLTAHDSAASRVLLGLRADLDSVKRSVQGLKSPTVFYVVFNDPPMTAGPNTFISQLVSVAGGQSIFDDLTANWPNVAMEEIVKRDPDIIIVPVGEFKGNSVERFRKMQGWRTLRAVREGNVFTVPADLLSRPSPNIGKAAHALRHAFFPQFAIDPALLAPDK